MNSKININYFLLIFLFLCCQNKERNNEGRSAAYWVEKLNLEEHPEGGYYKRTYESPLVVPKEELPVEYTGDRLMSTAIYFLLDKTNFSAFHQLKQDEMWHFYDGEPLYLHMIDEQGNYAMITLGDNPDQEQVLQYVVPGGTYFASETATDKGYSLVGCTVTPGFDFDDFIMPSSEDLTALYPSHSAIIDRLTRN